MNESLRIISILLLLSSCMHAHTQHALPAPMPQQEHQACSLENFDIKELLVKIELKSFVGKNFTIAKTVKVPYRSNLGISFPTNILRHILLSQEDMISVLEIASNYSKNIYTIAIVSFIKINGQFFDYSTHYLNLSLCQDAEISSKGQFSLKGRIELIGNRKSPPPAIKRQIKRVI